MSATMLRTTAVRSLPRPLTPLSRATLYNNVLKASLRTSSRPVKASPLLSLALHKPMQKSLVRYQTNNAYKYDIKKAEETLGKDTLKAVPDLVSSESSTRHITGEVGAEDPEQDVDMMATIRSDFVRQTSTHTQAATAD